MTQTTSQRVAAYRERRNMKTISLASESVDALARYQAHFDLKNRSEALSHAIERALHK